MATATVIRHVAFEDLGTFAPVLRQRGVSVRYLEAGDARFDAGMDAADLLIVLGGPIGAYDDENYPFLRSELNAIERHVRRGRPTLGICLGAQLMAHALGAAVYPGQHKEIGWSPLTLSVPGAQSCLKSLCANGLPVLHWHGDTFDVPADGVRLASSDLYENQAFSWGDAALGLQFHPEVSAEGLEHWYIGHAYELQSVPGLSVAGLRAEGRANADPLRRNGQAFFHAWLCSVGL